MIAFLLYRPQEQEFRHCVFCLIREHPLEAKIEINEPSYAQDVSKTSIPTPPGSPDVTAAPESEPQSPQRRRTSSKKQRLRKEDPGRPHLTLTIPGTGDEVPVTSSLYPVTPNIEEVSAQGISKAGPLLLPEFRTTLALVQILGGGGLNVPGDDRPECTLLSVRACLTRSWLLLVRLLYIVYTVVYTVSIYYLWITPLSNVTIFWPSTVLNLLAALSNHIALNRHTDKLYILLATLSARQPKNIKTCIVVVLASITAVTAMLTLRFYEVANSHRGVPLTGSKNWTVYTFIVLYFCRNFESLIVVGSTVCVMILYALIAAAIKFELRAIIEEPVPHESSLVRHSTISKLIAYADALFSPLCCFWVAAVIGNVTEGLAMARYHQTTYALPHITTWAHAVMLAAGYFAVCEYSFGIAVEAERVRLWVHKRYQGQVDINVLRYLNGQKSFPKTLTLWESIDLSRQAVVITLAFPVTLYTIILLILGPITHVAMQASPGLANEDIAG
ncbi:hypothetical protein BIW11_00055 [Tropilaelaps mercedesae]|uniref:Uncharacterized protein n=1 Tax=Tropilaelaps mercedesae TaxID=418985 RepID=A0A1V9Y2V5_9ACAR|nr:hypothetical protein BIW11_00055 [Tropilaelaps mercedesae]